MSTIQVLIELYDSERNSSEVFDISTLCNSVTIDSYLEGQPGKLTCIIQKDPNGLIDIKNGSIITVKSNNIPMFYGYVFTMGRDASETYKITAYDQMRYLKNNEIIQTGNQTASDIFEMVCKRAVLKYRIEHPSTYICPNYIHMNKTYYSIIEYGLQQTLINTGEFYSIRDESGILVFYDLSKMITNLIIGDSSLLTNYQYEISIDKDTATQVLVYRTDQETKRVQRWLKPNSDNIRRWGILRQTKEANETLNEAQIDELARKILDAKGKETKTMKLNAIGEPRLKAGDGFTLSIEALGISENMWIQSITHTLTQGTHFMQMAVFVQ